MENSEIVKKCHALLWLHRSKLESVWPTPPPLHAIKFAVTELGEMVDAHMRTFPEYKRNNDRDVDELDEAADIAMMLLTALPILDGHRVRNQYYTSAIEVAKKVVNAWEFMSAGYTYSAETEALLAVGMIADMEDMDLAARIRAKLERTEEKFGRQLIADRQCRGVIGGSGDER